uniref:Transmembrane protein 245-like n=1 Tax=Phallusia mammillata TaxID=59560 RepID=A0A6F9DUI0_9ASCI|nr:transmembrane protein 245-like [Phallusia mammillata]
MPMASISSTPITKLTRQRSMFIDSVAQLLPPGDEKPIKHALYTTASIALFGVVCGVAVSTYFVLQVFVKPLLWAVLCGSFLFPFKYTLHRILQRWLEETLDNGNLMLFDILVLPFTLFFNFSDWIGNFLVTKWKILLSVTFALLPIYSLYQLQLISFFGHTLSATVYWIWYSITTTMQFVESYNIAIATLLIIAFVSGLLIHSTLTPYISIAIWTFLVLFVVSSSGTFKVPIIFALIGLTALGTLARKSPEENKNKPNDDDAANDDFDESGVETINNANLLKNQNSKSSSDTYFNMLFAMFFIVLVWMHIWIVLLLMIPLTFWICKKIVLHAKSAELFNSLCQSIFNKSSNDIISMGKVYFQQSSEIIFPSPVRKLFKTLQNGDRKIHVSVLSSLPTVTSILIILFLFTTGIFFTMFMAVKVQQESVLAVQMASNVLNETVSNHPEYKAWLPDNDTMQNTMNSLVDKVYVQGREWISQKMQKAASDGSDMKNAEKQALRMWDQVYQTWFPKSRKPLRRLTRQSSMKNVTETGLMYGLVDFFSASEVIGWLQENVSSLVSIGESVLVIVQSNVGLIMYVFTSVFTTLLNGGTIVLNFVVSFVIFFTSLFYLLSSSKDQYKPLEIVGSAVKPLTLGTPFETAMQDAVSGVFGASIKMFGFYGLYTWVNHSMFGSNLVYIPSILAAIFGVIPLLTTYWVCIPSALEIWLLQGSLARAVGLFIFQFAPTLFVDAAIYRDISKTNGGGHPYITGLAVAGGLYTYGLEGAISGPLILCFLLVTVNLYTSATSPGRHASRRLLTET